MNPNNQKTTLSIEDQRKHLKELQEKLDLMRDQYQKTKDPNLYQQCKKYFDYINNKQNELNGITAPKNQTIIGELTIANKMLPGNGMYCYGNYNNNGINYNPFTSFDNSFFNNFFKAFENFDTTWKFGGGNNFFGFNGFGQYQNERKNNMEKLKMSIINFQPKNNFINNPGNFQNQMQNQRERTIIDKKGNVTIVPMNNIRQGISTNNLNLIISEKNKYESLFNKLKSKHTTYYTFFDEMDTVIDNYKDYMTAVNIQVSEIKEQLQMHPTLKQKITNIEQLCNYIRDISNKINDLQDITEEGQEKLKTKVENLHTKIGVLLKDVDVSGETDLNDVNHTLEKIKQNIERNIKHTQIIQKIQEKCVGINADIERKIGKAKQYLAVIMKLIESYIVDQLNQEYSYIPKNTQQLNPPAFSNINQNPQHTKQIPLENQNWKNIKFNDDVFNKGTIILGLNNFKEKKMLQSYILFNSRINGVKEDKFKSQLLRKNWHEICEVYDNFDIHEINFVLKAVGLRQNMYFQSCSQGFPIGADLEFMELFINNRKMQIKYSNSLLDLDIKLGNEQSANVHIKYKEHFKKPKDKFLRKQYYGISPNLAGQAAKFILRTKGNLEVIDIKDGEGFVKVNNDYIWGGIVPEDGYRRVFRFSRPTARWSIENTYGLIKKTPGGINDTKLIIPTSFYGGNISIISLKNSCPFSKDVKIIKEGYEIKFKNTNSNEVKFTTTGEISNRCKGEWNVELSDDEIKAKIKPEVIQNLGQLNKFAKQIINADKTNTPEYIKLCKWVNKNIKYDLNYAGRHELTVFDTLKLKRGVCHHMTLLFNALLYSIGYLTLYVGGYSGESSLEFDESDGHAWSLVRINNCWVPFDATWGIHSGKLPVCHVFSNFGNSAGKYITRDSGISFIPMKIKVIYLGD